MKKRKKQSKLIKETKKRLPKKDKKIEVTIKRKILDEAPIEYHFVLADGKKVKSIMELVETIEDMSEEVFRHHVNEFKNDFSSWVHDVFDEKDLAEEMKKVDNKVDTQIKMLKHLVKELSK